MVPFTFATDIDGNNDIWYKNYRDVPDNVLVSESEYTSLSHV